MDESCSTTSLTIAKAPGRSSPDTDPSATRIAWGTWVVVAKPSAVDTDTPRWASVAAMRSARWSSPNGSGALVLAKLGLLNGVPACTDLTTKPWVEEAGITVLNQPFTAKGNVATAGGCLSAPYLAAWVIARLAGNATAEEAMFYFAPVGEKEAFVARAMGHIEQRAIAC